MSKTAARLQRLYDFRHLLKQLVIKDIKLKYRRSFLGYVWSVLNPLLVMVVMLLVFSHMFRSNIENFPAYLIIGQTLFNFMSEATNQAIFSITGNAALLKKVYVPKYIFTLSKVTSSLVNLLFAMGAMLIVFIVSKVQFSLYMLFIPIVLIELYCFSLGMGLFLAQGAVFFRDIQYIYSVIITAWTYLTPLFYPIDLLPEIMQKAIKILNPMYHYVTQFRKVVMYQCLPNWESVLYGFFLAFLFLGVGTWSFLKAQDKFILYI
ncbi:MAG: ABC transporter permease [Roseburia sp. 1XD42-69]|jgi:ABC-type polysaccharide/polyol phosphate export systems, permease component